MTTTYDSIYTGFFNRMPVGERTDGVVRSCVRRLVVPALLTALFPGWALAAAPSQIYYVPFPETDALTALTAVENGGAGDTPVNPMINYISIAAIADGTVIYYDQWEDGYEPDHSYVELLQATTQIWGDGNPANGSPPGVADDLINAGTVILLYNQITTTSPQPDDYDARDKIVSTRAISVTRTYWASQSSTLFAGCVETFDTSKWGRDYRSPVGQNSPDSADAQMFEYTALSLMARDDGTTVRIDADNNGTFEATNTLSEGQTAFVTGVNIGGRVLADKPIQVILFSGDVGSNYESRDSSLLPMYLWSNNYYTPVSTPNGDATRVWLYNPGASSITVTYVQRVGTAAPTTNTTAVAAGANAAVELTSGAAARFYTSGSPAPVFYAYSTTDSDSTTTSDNQAWDWSFTLIPERLLSPQVLVGLGIGRDPLSSTSPTENGNPVWVTPVGNRNTPVTVYIDYDGDNLGAYTDANGNHYDASTNLVELQQAKLYDPDRDQTAMLIYVLSTNITLAAAWGQDTLTASEGAPGLDVGTSIPPVDVIDVSKDLAVYADANGDGLLGPGDRAEYLIRIGNTSRAPVPADVIIKDVLSAGVTYLTNSTAYRTATNGSWTAIADNGTGTPFPLDGSGHRISASIPVNGEFAVRFFVDVAAYSNLVAGQVSVINTGAVEAVVFDRSVTFRNEVDLHGSIGDRVWNDADSDGVQDAGEAGLNGVVVYIDANTNGVRDAGESFATTSGDGNYLLTGVFLVAGTHLVRVDPSTLPASDFIRTYDLDGLGSPNAASVALAGGQARTDVDFGYRFPARLGDFVWLDANGNGQQDVGEPGLSNVVVRLYTNSTVVVGVATSSVSGAYVFTNLAAGTYTVGFTPPSGYLFTTSNVGNDASDSDSLSGTNRTASIALASSQLNLTVDAGFYLPASLSGFVRVDLNGNGVAEAGDTNGIAGVTVQLLNAFSNVVATTTTAANGAYSFTNLAPGSYTVRETDLGGWYSTTDASAPNDNHIPVTLTSGQSSTNNNFHDAQFAALGDFVWLDANANGQQDDGGGSGFSNVVVHLYDANNVVVATATSTVAGAYAFTGLAAGTYTLGFTPPAGYLFTTSNVGADASDSDPLTGTNRTASVTLASGQTDNTVDAGFYLPASLSGYVRVDLNGNGVVEAGDTNGIAGATVQLLNATSNVVATTATAADGSYSFTNLRPGSYTVRETDLGGWYSTTDVSAPNDNLIPVTLAMGQNSAGNNFHDAQYAALGDFVWLDANANGQQDGGEAGLANVVVRLYGSNGVALATMTSTVAGAYAFTNLAAGAYTLGFTPPAGYLFSTSNVGSDASDSDPLAGTNRTAAVTLALGQTDSTVDAGFYQPAALSGAVRLDADGNGVVDPEDTQGLTNVTVRLLDAALNVVATAATSGTGAYSFSNLTPGSYTVVQALPSGYTNTVDVAAPNDLRIPLTLTSGQNSTGNDFYDTVFLAGLRSKVLYLSDPSQALDRIDPVAAGDSTTAQSILLSNSVSSGYATIGVANVTTGLTSVATSTTSITCVVRHTVPTGPDRLLVVGVSENISAAGGTDGTITNVAYGSSRLTGIGGVTNGDQVVSLFALVNPPVGTTNVVVTYATAPEQYSVVGVASFTNVNQTTPYGAFYSSTGARGNPSLTLPSAAGELVLDTVALQSSVLSGVGAGQTRRWTRQSPDNGGTANGGGSTKAGAASVTLTWTSTGGTTPWALGAVSLKPAPLAGVGSSTTFTQTPVFASAFTVPAGTLVRITNYIAVASGSMPTNPGVVATLAYGGTPFLTFSNPVYRAASSSLTWRAVVPAAVTIPAGQALALTVVSAQTGTTFRINFDSAAFPSKIVLPTTTVIDVPSLAVYDAPYAGGSAVTSSTATALRYVRVTVTDPFGAYDVSGVDLAIDGPGTGSDVGVTLGSANVVASNAVSKTYEYPWQTTATLGAYTLTATGREGSEGITATAVTSHTLTPQVAAVGDFVWVDANGNGQQDGGEPGLSNVVVRLYDSNSVVIATATSTVSGAYAFTGLALGAYAVGFTPPAGYLFTTSNVGADATDSDPLVGTNRTAAVTLPGSATNATVDAGFYLPASLSGFVREDLNGNGVAEADDTNGIAGVTVQLLNAASNVLATATTAANGAYSFTGLYPGAYLVRETDLGGWHSTADIAAPNDNLIPVTLTSGQASAGNNFLDSELSDIGDFVWLDANGNGQQDGGELGLSNVVVRLYSTNGVILATATSTVSGAYAFTGLSAGTYTLGFTPPASYLFTTSNVGGDASDSDPLAGTNRTAAVTLSSGESDSTVDAGFIPGASIAGFVRVDVNGNGVAEAGDTNGIAGVTVQLLNASSNVVATATTAADGSYAFANLYPGSYIVRETDLSGWYSTTDIAGANDNLIPVSLALGQASAGNNFHDTQRAAIGDFVWLDTNGNGQQDGGEPGLSNVVVRLYSTNNVVLATATSTVAGAYAFTNLSAGSYTVGFTPPAGYLFTSANTGADASDSDPLAGTNRTAAVTLTSGQTDSTVDAGFYKPAAIGDFVWADANGNGQQDVGETGVGGVAVALFRPGYGPDGLPGTADDADAVATTASGSGGAYSFTNLPPGTYQVGFGTAAGYYRTAADQGGDASDSDAAVGTGLTAAFAVASGETVATVDAGYQAVMVGDFVWTDANANGVQEAGEPGLAGVQVQVYTAAGVPYQIRTSLGTFADNFDPDGGLNGSTGTLAWAADWTAATGASVVLNTGSDYEIRIADGLNSAMTRSFVAPANTDQLKISFDYRSGAGNDTVEAQWSSNGTAWVTLASYNTAAGSSGTTNVTVATTAGTRYVRFIKTAQTGGGGTTEYMYFDNVSILAESALTPVTATTDAYGYYFFDAAAGLVSGTNYQLRVATNQTALAGLALTGQNLGGNDALDSDATLATASGFATLAFTAPAAGGSDQTLDFGFKGTASIGNFVWNDANGNGQQDAGAETNGLAGVTVRLYDSTGSVVGVVTSSVSGAYAFTDLMAGSYSVGFTAPAGYLFTTSNVGSDATDSDPLAGTNRTAVVTLASGQTDNTVDAGLYAAASISGFVRVDLNGNGVAEAGDTNGIAGVTVTLLDAGSNTVATASTAADGSYSFTGLRPGTYTVVETDLGGWYSTTDIVGPNDNRIPVALSIGQNAAGNNFHDTRYAALGDFVWLDADGNGQQGSGAETNGLSGVVVRLYDANGAVVGTATSTVAGAYAFTELAAGTYTVGFTPPAGYLFTTSSVGSAASDSNPLPGTNRTAAVTLASGQTDNTVDAGFYPAASISGFVRVDQNGNGVAEEEDTDGIVGVTVQLLDAASRVVATALTAADGSYAFTDLRPGAYTVRETDLADWYSTTDVSAPNDNLIPVALSIGQDSTGNNFHDTRYAELGNLVWNDADGNGQQDVGEAGLAGVAVSLYDVNGAVVGTATSTVAGAYAFTRLAAGSYTVGFSAPAGYLFTRSNVDSDDTDSDPLEGTNRTAVITLASGQTDDTVDAGLYAAASIAGFVRVDLNGNGAVEAEDTNALAGVTVQLLDAALSVVATAVTAADGSYSFTGLRPGDYTVQETDLGGWYSTADIVGPNDNLIPVALSVGQISSGNNFHDTQLAAFGDRVWTDLDGDGAFDAFETGISGVRVYADSDGSGTYDAGEPTAVTDANGVYQIGSLLAGTYTARVDVATLPAGLTQTYDLNGALDHAASVTLASGQARTDVDFGYRSPAVYVIRGQVRDDYDIDGTFSDPDKPVGGVTVTLFSDPNGDGNPADGAALTNVVTGADGRYLFTNVLSGAYVVVETDPTHSVSTGDTAGGNDNRIPVVIANADSVDNDFLDAVDPAGYLYDVTDGRIVPGGRVDVSGAGALVLMDGSSGQYMFISTNDAPSAFTVAVTPPPGYIVDPSRPAQPGSFDPTGGPDPTVLGSYENAANTGYLVHYSAASNTYYYAFTLEPGDPPVINNNFPLVKTVTVGDRVWLDQDGDGVQDAGEPGVTNVTVRLLDASNNVAAVAATDAAGAYLFTNLPPASYRVEFAPSEDYAFTVRDAAGAGDAADSDADRLSGRSDLLPLSPGTTNRTLDAGLYVPAAVFGYVFVDRDAGLVRNEGDSSVTNALVWLVSGGVTVAWTNTDSVGYYHFADVPAGGVSVLVSRAGAELVDVPTEEPAASDVHRNRALPAANEEAAITYLVTSGYGVLEANPGEPLNFGFLDNGSLSTALDVTVYASGSEVRMDIWTVNEAGLGDIVVYAWLGGAWTEVGRVPGGDGGQVVGEGNNRYTIPVAGLEAGAAYRFKIVDEAGHVHYSDGPLTVGAIRLDAVRLNLDVLTLAFNTEPGRRYAVWVSADLVNWSPEFVSVPTARGWSAYGDQPFTAGAARTEVRAPVNGRARAFFKIVRIED